MFQIVRVENGHREVLEQYRPETREVADKICDCLKVLDATAEFKAEVRR